MVLVFNNVKRLLTLKDIVGFSKKPTNRDPIKAPKAAPKIIDNLLLLVIISV
jgi:hypothetical protein